ncbi:metallophosphoesterase family protein [Devosia elaeis]|uniref:metallophosphoesterase family protein n=1 Tax=Devosia elaeis TaxID=1770058 RepID=UPI000832604B|nr:metallophosphoesterase family protein [Devosia elaeis]
MTTFFTADHHFGHANIIKMCDRPYDNITAHDMGLVENWNAVVGPDDEVWHLGDFAYRASPKWTRRLFEMLNGTKRLIVGNHDFKGETLKLPWKSIDQLTETVVDGQTLVLCHYSLRVWRNMRRGAVQLYGHSHGNLPGTAQSIDVGVDVMGYAPVTWPQIKQRLELQPKLDFRDDTDVVEAIEIKP